MEGIEGRGEGDEDEAEERRRKGRGDERGRPWLMQSCSNQELKARHISSNTKSSFIEKRRNNYSLSSPTKGTTTVTIHTCHASGCLLEWVPARE